MANIEPKSIQLFTKNISILYEEKLKKLNELLVKTNITSDTSPEYLNKIKNDLFSQSWLWPSYKLNREDIKGESGEEVFHPDTAHELLGNRTSSYLYEYKKLYYVKYNLKISTENGSLEYAVPESYIQFFATTDNAKNLIILFFTESAIDEQEALKIRLLKEAKLDQIEEILNKNLEYIASKELDFKLKISEIVDNTFKKALDKTNTDKLL